MKNRRLRIRPIIIILITAIYIAWPISPATASQLPYETYYKDGFGQLVKTQAAYIPAGIIGTDVEITEANQAAGAEGKTKLQLNQPKDLFVDDKDHIYIADTGNNRIVHLDEQGQYIREIKVTESPLKKPSGIYVDEAGEIYVADTGNNRVVRLDQEGKLLKAFGRPESSYLPPAFKYDPVNLIVDKRGFIYVTTLGAFQGLVQLDPEGNFISFFGPNRVSFSLFDAFKRFVYTREMYQRELKKLPGAIAGSTIDKNGFIYTVTKEISADQVKKLNIAGLDQLVGKGEFAALQPVRSYGEVFHRTKQSVSPQLNDITVDAAGNFTVIDSVGNMISQYDSNGNLLFFWGGDVITATSKTGIVKAPAAIASNSKGELLVLDSVNNFIQVLRLSEFGHLVHEANQLTQEGRYEQSEPLWSEVHRLNAQYTPALIGLAKAAYKKEEYARSEQLFYQAGVVGGYSESFWQNRLTWFQKHFGVLMNVALVLGVVYLLWNVLSKKLRLKGKSSAKRSARHPILEQLQHMFYLIKHPVDGFYAIRYENKAGWLSSILILVFALASYGYIQAGTSFVFNPAVHVGIDLFPITIQFVGIWLGFVVSNYLISSLLRGEGRFRDVFYGSCYALFPIILIGIPVTLLSNVLTLNELAIFKFLKLFIVLWVVLLFIWMVQGIHNYTFIEAIFIILLSLLALAIIVILIFILISLSIELVNFINSLYQEVIIR
ncbi:SMP-30/gluconolactonase/LRE family protein [Paenibacillus sp. NRS-1760]|uniref:SMP-30/gluconolactonase/LRE family protein n=1 Tax=Paenibacillus sp. NRS-1760 TaxID=3233902 RepID=UPI003D27CD42